MGGTRRREARSRGAGGPAGGLVVNRRSAGVEPERRRAWTGESSTDAPSVENLGDMCFLLGRECVSDGWCAHGAGWDARHDEDRWRRRAAVPPGSNDFAAVGGGARGSWAQGTGGRLGYRGGSGFPRGPAAAGPPVCSPGGAGGGG